MKKTDESLAAQPQPLKRAKTTVDEKTVSVGYTASAVIQFVLPDLIVVDRRGKEDKEKAKSTSLIPMLH